MSVVLRYFQDASRLRVLAGLLLLLLTSVSVASAQELVQPDGRLNQVAHFGGDALYCVDVNFVATTNYPEMLDDGGFRLLDSKGQVLWFVPASQIVAAIEESLATGGGVLVAEGQGTYGPVRLDTYFDGTDQVFVFSGYDEFSKPNSLTYRGCAPVGPIPEAPGDPVEMCTLVTNVHAKSVFYKALTPVFIPVAPTTTKIPCSQCPPIDAKLLGKLARPVNARLSEYCLEDAHQFV